ncbi:hypothetical protein ACQKMD_02905 [Viridibacillus sp. NPDC096237]|uniref:hypothetical protein n=1 Tax=Viridibacillus sp. NPDC096237 TaxID=3390721 RepID=UPI003D06DBBF
MTLALYSANYTGDINSILDSTDDYLENYRKLNKYGEYLNGIVNDVDVFSKLSVKQRDEILHTLGHYEEWYVNTKSNNFFKG